MLNAIIVKFINYFYNKQSDINNILRERIKKIDQNKEEIIKLTEQMQADEENLMHDYYFVKTIINTTPDNMYVYDIQEQKNIWSNNKIYDILGYTPTELQLKGDHVLVDLLHPDDYYNYCNSIVFKYNSLADDEILENDLRFKNSDGKYVWLHVRERVFNRDNEGNVKQIFGNAFDITEEMAYKETIRLQTAALDNSANAITITDKDGHIVFVNKSFCNNMEYDIKEVIGKNPRLLKSGLHSKEFYANMWDTILSGKVWSGDIINKTKSGKIVTDHTTITPVSNGKINYFIAIKERL